jgi:hypothetical protein
MENISYNTADRIIELNEALSREDKIFDIISRKTKTAAEQNITLLFY